MRSLFGETIPDESTSKRKRDHAHPAPVGSGPEGKTCWNCEHYAHVQHHDKVYRKCELMKESWTNGPGTDIRAKDRACRMFEEAKQERS